MKKMFFILLAVMSFASIEAFAQEVRGVETKVSIYDGPEYSGGYKWAAYAFTNTNSFAVSVDAELYRSKANDSNFYQSSVNEGGAYITRFANQSFPKLISTKSFVLKPGETYLWKHEQESYGDTYYFRSGSKSWAYADCYFVKYKAYKKL